MQTPQVRAYWRERGYAGPSPQRAPSRFSSDELMNEVRHLMALNRRYGSNALRTATYTRLLQVIAQRGLRHHLRGRPLRFAERLAQLPVALRQNVRTDVPPPDVHDEQQLVDELFREALQKLSQLVLLRRRRPGAPLGGILIAS